MVARCVECDENFDTDYGGECINDKAYCQNCVDTIFAEKA